MGIPVVEMVRKICVILQSLKDLCIYSYSIIFFKYHLSLLFKVINTRLDCVFKISIVR